MFFGKMKLMYCFVGLTFIVNIVYDHYEIIVHEISAILGVLVFFLFFIRFRFRVSRFLIGFDFDFSIQ